MLPLEIREHCYYLRRCERKRVCLEELLCSVEQTEPTKYDECYLLKWGSQWVRLGTPYTRLIPSQINWGLTFPMYQLSVAKSSRINLGRGRWCSPLRFKNNEYAYINAPPSMASFKPSIYRDLYLVKHSDKIRGPQYYDSNMQLLPCCLQK